MELIHLVHRRNINHLLDLLHRKKVAADIEQHTTVAKVRRILNLHNRHTHRIDILRRECLYRNQLSQSLKGVEDTRSGCSVDIDTRASNLHCVPLCLQRVVFVDVDDIFIRRISRLCYNEALSEGFFGYLVKKVQG